MTPHRLTANEKVTELDNPIAAAAILSTPGLVAVLLTGPSRLALVPLTGGVPHVIALPLEGPQEIALLSANTALVRTADGSVWALANLAGEARPKAIAQEIRSLHGRSGGANALGIGIDGSATAFSVARGEISARTFTARGGALRTADLDEHVTYVIAEGDEGGVFRIHPGATPELGTSARAVLPREALDLDRLRGGASLAIAFKRGEPTIAAITGGPRRFDARLVQLGGKVADAAVIGACLAVVFLDGRAALYDEETLARAGAEPTQPTSAIALGIRGRPRALLATTNKGAPSLWLGTTSGELLSIAVELAEAKAPEEAPKEIDAPVEETAAPVEETAAIEPAPIAEESAIASAEPVAAPEPEPAVEPAPDLAARIAEIDAELETVRTAFKNVEAAREQERNDAAEATRRALAEAAERSDLEVAALRSSLAEVETAREKERSDAADEMRRALADVDVAREKERSDAAEDKLRALVEVDVAREKERSDAAEEMLRALAEAAERAARELATTVRAEREEGELALSDRGRALETSNALEIRALKEEHSAAFARVEQSHDQALVSRDEATATLKQRLDEEQLALASELDATAKRLGAEVDRAIALEAELAVRTGHLASEHAEVDGLRAEIDRLREETARQKAELDEQKGEIKKLDAAMRRERERAVVAERAAEGVINVDRAREKLGGMLDRVRSEIQKRR